jgi:hypothetical protein
MWHSAKSRLGAMPHRMEFFGIAWSRNKILSAFTEAVTGKLTVYQKIGNRRSCLPHGSKILSLALSNKKKLNSPLCSIEWGQFMASNRIELLHEFESIFKTDLDQESGDPGLLFKEKTKGRKSHETIPLRKYTTLLKNLINTGHRSH